MGMPSCREVYGLRTSGELERCSWWLRMGASLHMAMCAHCRRLARQLEAVGAALRGHLAKPRGDLSALRRRILDRLSRG